MTSSHKNIVSDQWLAGILQCNVYKIILNEEFIREIEKANNSKHPFFKILGTKPVFLYARLPTTSAIGIRFLEKYGFYLVDTNIILEKPISLLRRQKAPLFRAGMNGFLVRSSDLRRSVGTIKKRSPLIYHGEASLNKLSSNHDIRFALAKDQKDVVALAKRSFMHDRFHVDNYFSKETADTIKAEWARNYFLGKRGEKMVVALNDSEIIGFLQLIKNREGILTIDLIAVDKNYRKQGIASEMISYAQNSSNGIDTIRVGTQISNIASIKLYEKLGFSVAESHYIFHYNNS